MKRLFYSIYKSLPLVFRLLLQKAIPFLFSQKYSLMEGQIRYKLLNRELDFKFAAPLKIFQKAKLSGIENQIIRYVANNIKDKQNGLIFDVGLNYGFLSLVWSKTFVNNDVYGFEANSEISSVVEKIKIDNGIQNLHVITAFVSNENNKSIHVTKGIYTGSYEAIEQFKDTDDVIETIILDDFMDSLSTQKPVLAIKIDTDGADYEVLQGCERIIRIHKPFIAIELNGDVRILEYLFARGYKLYDMGETPIEFDSRFNVNDPKRCNIFGVA
jgi:FkbM family methyltransferase